MVWEPAKNISFITNVNYENFKKKQAEISQQGETAVARIEKWILLAEMSILARFDGKKVSTNS